MIHCSRLRPVFILAALAALLPAQTPAVPAKLSVAVVDMQRAASHTKAFQTGIERRTAMGKEYNRQLKEMERRIKELGLDIEPMRESPERMEKEIERETLIGRHGLAGKMFKRELERQRVINDDKIYVELSAAVAELAAKREILLVLRKHPHRSVKDMLDEKLVQTVNEAIAHQVRANQQRIVIYHAKPLDLTEDLIKYLKK